MRPIRPEATADDDLSDHEPTSSTALVQLAEPAQWSRPMRRGPSPDPTFVAQLIADAEQFGLTRSRLRESAADALSAYRARQRRPSDAGLLTRQTV
jgi:hypothetical protein